MRFRTWLIAGLLFGSGFCALVYQIAWLREFRLIFGASTAASAAVLAIFIGGLGLGGLLIGPRADRHPHPLRLYALLEAIVSFTAAATPLLLTLVRSLYFTSGGSTRLGGLVATLARVLLSTLVLAVPTIAMGGTLPAATRAATRERDDRRTDLAALYALNTLGAVLGCIVATFWLLESFGTRQTIWIASGLNLLVAALALVATLVLHEPAAEDEVPSRSAEAAAPRRAHGGKAARERTPSPPASSAQPSSPDMSILEGASPVWFLLTASATIGFAFFLMELVWYRMLGPLLGGSVFTFGLVLAVALAGVGLGGLIYALGSSHRRPSLAAFGWTCLLEGAAVAATYALGDHVATFALTLLPLGGTTFAARAACWTLVTTIVVFPPALAAGYQFPLLIALFGRARHKVGAQVGQAYAANTVGAIAGSLAGGFGILPWLSAPGSWRLVALVLVVLGALAMFMAARQRRNEHDAAAVPSAGTPFTQILPQAALAVLTLLLTQAEGPTAIWRHTGIGAGRASTTGVFASANQFRTWSAASRRGLVWEADGVESSVALSLGASGYAFYVNGKSDGAAREDAGTQVMTGLLGALAHPNPRSALVIGLGTGSTAGWLGAVPSIERVDVVELERLILDVARACAPVNHDVLTNPKVHITIGDARETLLTSAERYDVIASEPSNPFRSGIASLFTLEYYKAAAARLTDSGVFVQWVQAYEIDAPTLRTAYATLSAVFPQVETWHTNRGDLVLVASKAAHAYKVQDLAARIAQEPFKTALAVTWRAIDVQGLLAHYLGTDAFARAVASGSGAALNTDDRNVIEFGLARSVGRAIFTVADVRNAARTANMNRPPLDDQASVNWAEVDTGWLSYSASEGSFIDTEYKGPPNEQARQAALVRYFRNGDVPAARQAWAAQPNGPRDPTEMAMVADILATDVSEIATPVLDQLRLYQPTEADIILATLRFRQTRYDDAVSLTEGALARLRTDPWPLVGFKERAVQLAQALARRNEDSARRMFDALGQPFAIRSVDDTRLIARAEIARVLDFPGLCRAAVGALEPHVPWTESFLTLRRDCYQITGDPRLASASRDLQDLVASGTEPLLTK